MAHDVSSGGAGAVTAPTPSGSDPTGSDPTGSDPTGFDHDRPESIGSRVQHLLHGQPTLGPLAVLILSIIVFAVVGERFMQPANLSLVLQQVTVIAILALGQTVIILTAGIDLSVGAIAVFSSILMAALATRAGLPGILALVVGLSLGTAMGVLNGLLVTRLKLPPFIVTLGTLSVFTSLNLFVSDSATVRGADMPGLMTWTGTTFSVGGFRVTYGSILMLALFGALFYSLRSTAWGKHVYATGDDTEAARLAGIRTDRVLLSVYTVAGLLYAIGAWVLIGRLASASPNVGTEYNLQSITAVVIGGTSLFGGRGNVIGTLIGALIVGVFANGLKLAGVDVLWTQFATGVLVIAAVSIDQWIRKVKA
jgi:fructose transport system permease protein